jgi:hypothetical protein
MRLIWSYIPDFWIEGAKYFKITDIEVEWTKPPLHIRKGVIIDVVHKTFYHETSRDEDIHFVFIWEAIQFTS